MKTKYKPAKGDSLAPQEVVSWSFRAGSANPWLLVKMQTEDGLGYRAIYWSLKRREFMVSTTTYSSIGVFKASRQADTKVSSNGVPLRQAIQEGWMPDFLTGA